jgi:formamidopyrimidine-DNA glycosylase
MQPGLRQVQKLATGRTVEAVTRRAKRILLKLDNGWAFVIEPRMTGLMLVDAPPDREHLRLEWKLARGRRRHSVWFWDRRGLGTVRLLSPEQQASVLGDSRLGPDALDFTPELWRQRLSATDRPVKVALLDQKLVAGIGNLYASEILHRAGIHPARRSSALSLQRLIRLHDATMEILRDAILYEGSTLGDGTYRNALNKSGGYQNQHRVYGKANETCSTCRQGAIKRIVQAQRSTFYCPRCQK